VPQHVARLVTRLVAPLVVDYSVSRRLTSTTSRPPHVWVPLIAARLVARLVVDFVDYSASSRLVVD
jgi:hypothetical protein